MLPVTISRALLKVPEDAAFYGFSYYKVEVSFVVGIDGCCKPVRISNEQYAIHYPYK
jgi:hypothetical protein